MGTILHDSALQNFEKFAKCQKSLELSKYVSFGRSWYARWCWDSSDIRCWCSGCELLRISLDQWIRFTTTCIMHLFYLFLAISSGIHTVQAIQSQGGPITRVVWLVSLDVRKLPCLSKESGSWVSADALEMIILEPSNINVWKIFPPAVIHPVKCECRKSLRNKQSIPDICIYQRIFFFFLLLLFRHITQATSVAAHLKPSTFKSTQNRMSVNVFRHSKTIMDLFFVRWFFCSAEIVSSDFILYSRDSPIQKQKSQRKHNRYKSLVYSVFLCTWIATWSITDRKMPLMARTDTKKMCI